MAATAIAIPIMAPTLSVESSCTKGIWGLFISFCCWVTGSCSTPKSVTLCFGDGFVGLGVRGPVVGRALGEVLGKSVGETIGEVFGETAGFMLGVLVKSVIGAVVTSICFGNCIDPVTNAT
jgi:hypothetical protein